MSTARVLYRDLAVADATSDVLARGRSALLQDGVLLALDDDGALHDPAATEVDSGGATLVPGLVDSHAHVTMPGGDRWVPRGLAPTEELLAAAEEAGELMVRAGVRHARDVGSARRAGVPVAVRVRDAWDGRADRPRLRSAGTWVARRGHLPAGLAVDLDDGDDLLAAVTAQVAAGADGVKLYLDGAPGEGPVFTESEVRAAVAATATTPLGVVVHAMSPEGARCAAAAGVRSIEHGARLDAATAALMAAHGTTLVPTLAVYLSVLGFATTTSSGQWAEREGWAGDLLEGAQESVRLALDHGVAIAAGSDAGGGSVRHGSSVAWEVQALHDAGVPGWQALAAATWRGGDLLGDPEAGRLVVGRPARALLVHGDPYRDPTALWRVWRTL